MVCVCVVACVFVCLLVEASWPLEDVAEVGFHPIGRQGGGSELHWPEEHRREPRPEEPFLVMAICHCDVKKCELFRWYLGHTVRVNLYLCIWHHRQCFVNF